MKKNHIINSWSIFVVHVYYFDIGYYMHLIMNTKKEMMCLLFQIGNNLLYGKA